MVFPLKKISGILFFGLFILTACASVTPTLATPTLQPTATATKVMPTPSNPGNSIQWRDLQVTMVKAEITDNFSTDFGSTRIPSPGMKFMWVYVQLKNVGQNQIEMPLPENFSVLYVATELKPTYGHRKEYADYTALDPVLFPNQQVDAWLRFDIPINAELKDLRFVFLPESLGVGTSFSSPIYPYAEDHPAFVWKCAP